jgi:hypothetical protein
MFARVKQSRNGEYLQIVENYRDGDRVRQRMVLYVGHYDSIDKALKVMPREVGSLRRRATEVERLYDAMAQHAGAGAGPLFEKDLATRRERAERARGEAEELAAKLEVLRGLAEEHPDLLSRDRGRAERRRRRERTAAARTREGLSRRGDQPTQLSGDERCTEGAATGRRFGVMIRLAS